MEHKPNLCDRSNVASIIPETPSSKDTGHDHDIALVLSAEQSNEEVAPAAIVDSVQTDGLSLGWLQDVFEHAGTPPFVVTYHSDMSKDSKQKLAISTLSGDEFTRLAREASGRDGPTTSANANAFADVDKLEDMPGSETSNGKGKGKAMWQDDATSQSHTPSSDIPPRPRVDAQGYELHWRGFQDLPVEMFALILKHLAYDDLRNMRMTSKALEQGVSAYMFETVVLPFNRDIYGKLATDSLDQPTPSKKGKERASDHREVRTLDMFRGFGGHIKRFGLSFDVDMEALANPPDKVIRESKNVYWGSYDWCFEHYVRYVERADLEDAADKTSIMKRAFEELGGVQHLSLSLDAGLGLLAGPGLSLRDRVLNEPSAVWNSSAYATPPDQAANRRLWLELSEAFKKENKMDALQSVELVHFDHASIQKTMRNIKQALKAPLQTRHSLLHNVYSGPADAFKSKDRMDRMIPDWIFSKIPKDIWTQLGINADIKPPQLSWKEVWTDARWKVVKSYLMGRADMTIPVRDENEHPFTWQVIQVISSMTRAQTHETWLEERTRASALGNRNPFIADLSDDDDVLLPMLPQLQRSSWRNTSSSNTDHSIARLASLPVKSMPPSGVIVALPICAEGFDLAARCGSSFNTKHLDQAQREWLLETAWAQEAFLTSYILAITDATLSMDDLGRRCTVAQNVKSLTLTRFSSKHLPILYRDDFWEALPNLTEVNLLIIADWRDVVYSPSSSATLNPVDPSEAVSSVHYLVVSRLAHRPGLKKLSLGWADGGEEAKGRFARNNYLLPAPLVPSRSSQSTDKVFPDMARMCHLEELTLKNCWVTPNLLRHFLNIHKGSDCKLRRLTLDSVSMTAHPGFMPNNVVLPPGVTLILRNILTTLLPGLQPLRSNLPQPAAVITGVHQLAAAATAAGDHVPPLVTQFVQAHPMPVGQSASANTPNVATLAPAAVTQAGILGNLGHQQPMLHALNQLLGGHGPQLIPAQPPNPVASTNNAAGHRIGSWPDVLANITKLLHEAGKSSFELKFLSCGYALLPLAAFEQSWLLALETRRDGAFHNIPRNNLFDHDSDDEDIAAAPAQPQRPVLRPLVQAGTLTNANATTTPTPAAAPPTAAAPVPAPDPRAQQPLARPPPTTAALRRAHDELTLSLLKEAQSNTTCPSFARIISALPEREASAIVEWSNLHLGWPTPAMGFGLVEQEGEEYVPKVEGESVEERRRARACRRGWRRWGDRRREDTWWDGQRKGGEGRFSGVVRAVEGGGFGEDGEEEEESGGGSEE